MVNHHLIGLLGHPRSQSLLATTATLADLPPTSAEHACAQTDRQPFLYMASLHLGMSPSNTMCSWMHTMSAWVASKCEINDSYPSTFVIALTMGSALAEGALPFWYGSLLARWP